jgi:hypothetical protein
MANFALKYGCRGQFSGERRRHMEDGAKIWRALIMPFSISARGRLNARASGWTRGFRTPGCRAWHKTLLKSTPRILNFYRCASNYSSAHLTLMNDIVAGIVLGGGGRVVIVENKKQKRQKIVEHASGSDFIPTLLSRPKQTCVRSCTQQLSHENTYFAIAPGFDGPAGCPTQSRIRFRRLWLR